MTILRGSDFDSQHNRAASPEAERHMRHRPRRHKMFVVRLDAPMRRFLEETLSGNASRRDKLRAQALMAADQSDDGLALTDVAIARETGLSVRTIETLRKRFALEGIASAVSWRRKRIESAATPNSSESISTAPEPAQDGAIPTAPPGQE